MSRAPGVLLVLVALLFLPIAAMASPPDPTWIGGIYDSADGDDEVMLVLEMTASRAGAPEEPAFRPWCATDLVRPPDTADESPHSLHRERGPPHTPARHLTSALPGGSLIIPSAAASSPLLRRLGASATSSAAGVCHDLGTVSDARCPQVAGDEPPDTLAVSSPPSLARNSLAARILSGRPGATSLARLSPSGAVSTHLMITPGVRACSGSLTDHVRNVHRPPDQGGKP